MLRFLFLLLALSGFANAACVIDAVTVPDAPLAYVAFKPGAEKREMTVRVRCERAQDRYGLQLLGSVQASSDHWKAELRPRRGPGAPLRITLEGAAAVFGPSVTFGGDWSSAPGPRTYSHTLTIRALSGQWVAGGDYIGDLRVAIHDL